MPQVTTPVTPGLRVHIPDVQVRQVEIIGDDIRATVAPSSKRGPFSGELLAELLLNKDPMLSERAKVLHSYNHVTREFPQNALEEFLRINRAEDVAAFVQRWGTLADVNSVPLQFVLGQVEQMKILLWITKAIRENNEEDLQESLADAKELGLDITSDASAAIAFHLTKHLAASVPALLPTESGLSPVLTCRTVIAGLYGLLLSAVIDRNPWGLCEYTHCRRPFRVSNTLKRFCSERCQQIAKQRRYRESLGPEETEG